MFPLPSARSHGTRDTDTRTGRCGGGEEARFGFSKYTLFACAGCRVCADVHLHADTAEQGTNSVLSTQLAYSVHYTVHRMQPTRTDTQKLEEFRDPESRKRVNVPRQALAKPCCAQGAIRNPSTTPGNQGVSPPEQAASLNFEATSDGRPLKTLAREGEREERLRSIRNPSSSCCYVLCREAKKNKASKAKQNPECLRFPCPTIPLYAPVPTDPARPKKERKCRA